MSDASPVTQILQAIDQGDAEATDRLLPSPYDELRRLAAQIRTRVTADRLSRQNDSRAIPAAIDCGGASLEQQSPWLFPVFCELMVLAADDPTRPDRIWVRSPPDPRTAFGCS